MKPEGLPRTLRNCRTSYSDEELALRLPRSRKGGTGKELRAGLASGPGPSIAPQAQAGATPTRP